MKAFILLNGDLALPPGFAPPGPEDLLVAADGGGRAARRLGWRPSVLVGDFDSLEPSLLDYFQAQGVPRESFPKRKDLTDFELALQTLKRLAPAPRPLEVAVLAALGGRWDMSLANLALAGSRTAQGLDLTFYHGGWRFKYLTGPAEWAIKGRPGDRFSLIVWNSPALGVTLKGFEYSLTGGNLEPGTSQGLSNVVRAVESSVSLVSGGLLAAHESRP